MEKENNVKETVRKIFADYLNENKCRKTPERFAILELIYTEQRHFDMDTLYEAMNERNFRVSRATLYNTMQLLLDCKLVLKHQFGQSMSFYERAYHNDYHHHLICTRCHKVQEYKDTEIKNLIHNKKINRFTPTHFSLYIYGICGNCARELKKTKDKK